MSVEIKNGSTLFVSSINKGKDPLKHCIEKNIYYNPVVSYQLDLVSDVYQIDGKYCFDVKGEFGSLNKGRVDNSRRVFFDEIGLFLEGDETLQDIQILNFLGQIDLSGESFKIYSEEFYRIANEASNITSLSNQMKDPSYKLKVYTNALDHWGFSVEKENVLSFIKQNELNSEFH